MNLLDKSDIVTVSGGSFPVNIENGQPKIYHPEPSEWENPAVPGADDEGGVHHGEGEEPSEWENPAVPGADDEGGVHHGEGEWENPAVPGADDEGGVHHGEGEGASIMERVRGASIMERVREASIMERVRGASIMERVREHQLLRLTDSYRRTISSQVHMLHLHKSYHRLYTCIRLCFIKEPLLLE